MYLICRIVVYRIFNTFLVYLLIWIFHSIFNQDKQGRFVFKEKKKNKNKQQQQ